jgi:serine/threonine-protein kinase HipA
MGALEFRPVKGPRARKSQRLKIEALVELASQVLQHRHDLATSFAPGSVHAGLTAILRVGTSAGGARPKALIAWNLDTLEVRSGQVAAPGIMSSQTQRASPASSMPTTLWRRPAALR